MHRRFFTNTAILLILTLILTGCGIAGGKASAEKTGKSGQADQTRFNIVTSFYPVYIATINVTKGIEGVVVTNMTKPQTGCLHDYSLRPDDLKMLERADAFVINGAGMESFLDDVIKQRENLRIITAAADIPLIKDRDGVDNPHVWVSITNEIKCVENIADQLSAVDPAHSAQYIANKNAYTNKLKSLKDELHKELDGLKNKDIITFHEAFPYFAQEFGLNIAAVVEREPGSEPSPKELGGIIDAVEKTGSRALFAEPQYSSKAADAIARETGAKVYSLDPGVTGDSAPDVFNAYLETMWQNGRTLKEALE
ncbi:MAG TPA: metal ABC transporter substrate-binding protein [Clostridia bacterium]|nr:metal ABC transporter substrate-binding protein [Clostridia bacterium]